MKKVISIILISVLLVFACVSCGKQESAESIAKLINFMDSNGKDIISGTFDETLAYIQYGQDQKTIAIKGITTDDSGYYYQSFIYPSLVNSDGTHSIYFWAYVPTEEEDGTISQSFLCQAEVQVNDFSEITNDYELEYVNYDGSALFEESSKYVFSNLLSDTLNAAEAALQTISVLDISINDIGFSEFEVDSSASSSTEEDLGGIFSGARLSYSLRMTVLGLATVFAVLALLWGILVIFRIFMYDIPKKRAASKETAEPKEETVAHEETAVTNDGELIAVITAAISAAIDSDPELSKQYAGGFRVVSYKRTGKIKK